MSKQISFKFSFLIILAIGLFSSCKVGRKIRIFTDLQNDSSSGVLQNKIDNTIKTGDILSISVFCEDELALRRLNVVAQESGTGAASSGPTANGYLVNDSGYIKYPVLGQIKCVGMSKEALADHIKNGLLDIKYVLNPIVTVRIINFKITMLGEINRPGVFSITNEKINIIEAIGMAGDLTVYAKRDNILLIRETNGKKVYKRFSLNDPELFNKDHFILQNNDIIYIEPLKAKNSSVNRSTQFFNLALSSISVLLLIYSQLIVRN